MHDLIDPYVVENPDPADFEDRRLAKLLDHWHQLCGARALPAADAIDPTALKFILGWLMIIDPIDGGEDFSYRLYGSSIADAMGRDLTGCKLSDSFPEFAAFASAIYRDAMRRGRPVLTRHRPPKPIFVIQWERLILPFSGAAGGVTRFLVGAVPLGTRSGEKGRLPWPLRGT